MAEKTSNLFQIVQDGFTDGSHYDKYRPDYTPETTSEILRMLTAESVSNTDGECDILELGAGTGKLTRHLYKALPTNLKFVASEPMVDFLTTLRDRCPGVSTIQCTADSLPFPDNSVQGIVAAQCFHWFANEASMREITRVLRPNGSFILVWNIQDIRVNWVNALTEKVLSYYADDEPQYIRFWWKKAIDDFKGLRLKTRKELDFPASEYTTEDIKTFYSTLSAFSRMTEDDQKQALEELIMIVKNHPATIGKTTVAYPRIVDLFQYVKQ